MIFVLVDYSNPKEKEILEQFNFIEDAKMAEYPTPCSWKNQTKTYKQNMNFVKYLIQRMLTKKEE
jgi:hypothetical protein